MSLIDQKRYQSKVGKGPWRAFWIDGQLVGIEIWEPGEDRKLGHLGIFQAPRRRNRLGRWLASRGAGTP